MTTTTTAARTTARAGSHRTRSPATAAGTGSPGSRRRNGATGSDTTTSSLDDSTTAGRPPAGTDERVRTALAAAADLTAAAVAEATGLGRSTVGKALARLETAGLATRTPGARDGGTRPPDQWNLTTTPPTPPGTSHAPAASTEHTSASTGNSSGTGSAGAIPPSTSRASAASAGQTPGSIGDSSDTDSAGTIPPSTSPPAGSTGQVARRNPKTGTERLAPGALTGLVADHFAAHPGVRLTAGDVGRALNRSAGAVRNACDKLARDGVLRLAGEAPRSYTTTG
jgi:predicted transcriptional regulator